MTMKVTATTNLKALGEKLREKPRVTAVVGVANSGGGDPSLMQIMEWLHDGWVQVVTPKQSGYFMARWGIPLSLEAHRRKKANQEITAETPGQLVLPPRPFFRGVFYEKQEALLKLIKTALKKGYSPKDAVLIAAREMQSAVQAAIARGGTETEQFKKLSGLTMEIKQKEAANDLGKKGRKKRRDSTGFALSDRPFASDGARQMIDAIKYELKE